MDKMVKTVEMRIKRLEEQTNNEQAVLFVDGFSMFGWK